MHVAEFIAKWRKSTLTERAASQSHFLDLCDVLGHPKPSDIDPAGESFAFERGADKQGGGHGWADVWKRGFFGWEYKGKHKDLNAAYDQLLKYREALENPPLLVVSDMERIIIRTNFTGTVTKRHELHLEELLDPQNLQLLRDVFHTPERLKPGETSEGITTAAAEKVADIAQRLRSRGLDPKDVARFLDRMVFCLFAEDIRLLPVPLFTKIATESHGNPKRFTKLVSDLFEKMASGGDFGFDEIRHFNGDLFTKSAALELTEEEIKILSDAAKLDWSAVDPSIFGTLFERGMDPGKRSQLGAHYTSRQDIETVIEPVIMAPLRRDWESTRDEVARLLAGTKKRFTEKGVLSKPVSRALALLQNFQERLSTVKILDPACGSGNFLYVTLQKLKDLEKEVIVFRGNEGLGSSFPLVGPWQVYGIERNEYAHELAQMVVWIGYLQWQHANGFEKGIDDPILKPMNNFECKDAILDLTDPRHPSEAHWPDADFIVGNPPFLGGKRMRAELGDDYVNALFKIYDGRVPREADLVAYWFEKARAEIAREKSIRAGLLATQSIRAGANRKILAHIKETGDIFMAWSDEPWVLDGADVRVSMVGFDGRLESRRTLDGSDVVSINPNLTTGVDLTKARRLAENANLCFMGDTKGGPFDIPATVAAAMVSAPINPNGCHNSAVVRAWVNGLDVTGRPRNTWIVDFGTEMLERDAALYELPFEHVRRTVLPIRATNNRASYRDRWWIHVEPRPAMRKALGPHPRYIVTPRVAKHRLFSWVPSGTLPDSRLYVFPRHDDYFFGLLNSRVHETWALATSSRHGVGNDPTYNNTTCFETFPFPWPPGQEPMDDPRVITIGSEAKHLNELREAWRNPPGASESELRKRTLTNLYNQRPTWLDMAHRKLDDAVFLAYGWPSDLPDEEILQRLLHLNLARALEEP